MSFEIIYENENCLSSLQDNIIAVLGFGNQGHAQALNARDSGLKVIVSNRKNTYNGRLANDNGFCVLPIDKAVKKADMILITIPDEIQPIVFDQSIRPHLRTGQTICFAHGLNIHFKKIIPPSNINVIMVAPKGSGEMVRSEYLCGNGVPCFIGVYQDTTADAKDIAIAWATAIGGARAGIFFTTFKNECEADLFGEQAVLCGGMSALIKAGFDTLVNAGYPRELAYFEICHELKSIIDMIHKGGISYMRHKVSNTAEWGDLSVGARVIDNHVKGNMRKILKEIQNGVFIDNWYEEHRNGLRNFKSAYISDYNHKLETTGRLLRSMIKGFEAKIPPF